MKTLTLALAVLLMGCSQQPPPTSSTFALAAGENSGFPVREKGRLRVTVEAEQPVTVALVTQSALAAWRADPSKTIPPSQIVCVRTGIVRASLDCTAAANVEAVVSDQRGLLDKVAAGLTLAVAQNSRQADAAMSRNRVTLTVSPQSDK